jgi:hypothetical protein
MTTSFLTKKSIQRLWGERLTGEVVTKKSIIFP